MNEDIVRNSEDVLDALKKASQQLSRVAFSSAYSLYLERDLEKIMTSDEFMDVFTKLNNWSVVLQKAIDKK